MVLLAELGLVGMLRVNWPIRSSDWKVWLGHDMIRSGRMVNRNCEDQETNIGYFMVLWCVVKKFRFPRLFSSCVIHGIDMGTGIAKVPFT